MPRYLGIDYGEKRVGLALSDPSLTLAQPLKTIKYSSVKKLITEIVLIIKEYEVKKIILGLPLTMRGTDSQKTREVKDFGEKLGLRVSVPVVLFDERLSTQVAHQVLRQLGKQPSKSREIVDQIAAQDILQTYIEKEKRMVRNEEE
jgi:putative Holliday junction resolvase